MDKLSEDNFKSRQAYQQEIERLNLQIEDFSGRVRKMLSLLPLGTIIINKKGMITAVNRKIEQWFGYSPSEIYYKPAEQLLSELDTTNSPGILLEITGIRKDSSRFPVEIQIADLEIDSRSDKLIFVQDISERKRLEQLRRQLISIVSHDMRNPVTTISFFLQLLQAGMYGDLSGSGGKALAGALTSSMYLQSLLRHILVSEKIDSGNFTIDFKETSTGKVIEKLLAISPDRERIKVDYTNDAFVADEDLIVQVLSNLATNAIKYSAKDRDIEITAGLEGVSIRFTVRDSGPGIKKEDQLRIFERFEQAGDREIAKSGFGLGLAICKTIVEEHRGKIWVESEPGKGASFIFTVPTRL